MKRWDVFNARGQFLGTYTAKTKEGAAKACERELIESGARVLGFQVLPANNPR